MKIEALRYAGLDRHHFVVSGAGRYSGLYTMSHLGEVFHLIENEGAPYLARARASIEQAITEKHRSGEAPVPGSPEPIR